MSRLSGKSKAAALLVALTVASSGALAPSPALARPGCEEAQFQSCNTWMPDQHMRVWQWMGYSSIQECTADFIATTCPWMFSGSLKAVRDDRLL